MVLKADKRCHKIRWHRSRFLQTLVVIFPRKSTQVEIHTKMAIFWLVFSAKSPVKSDKLALIEVKILNLMFFDINIPVVPIETWLWVTHNHRQKTLKVASVLLFRRILKTKSWLECGSSLLKFPDVTGHSTWRCGKWWSKAILGYEHPMSSHRWSKKTWHPSIEQDRQQMYNSGHYFTIYWI